jgi:endonuclease-3
VPTLVARDADAAAPLVALPPAEKALVAHERLCRAYGCPIAYFHDLDPLSELVSSLLSHRTRNADSGRAFRALRARYASWTALRDAPTAEVEATIAGVTWPEQKAPRIQAILRAVAERVGHLEADALDFLGALPPEEARTWLEALPGVGPKTSAAVLSFSRLRGVALPVDSHHHRVAVRLGLIPASVAVGPSHARLAALLPEGWDAQTVYDHHEVLMLHGQRVCFWREPACARCVVLDLCPTGQARLGEAARGVRPDDVPPRATRGAPDDAHTRPEPQELPRMSDATNQSSNASDRPDVERELNRMNEEARAQDARSPHPKPSGDVNDREHYRDGHAERAHGTHGKGFMDERMVDDEQATDTGDDPQLRTAGGGGDDAPDPQRFRENSAGRMGGPGWGSEQVGGSVVDRRPPDNPKA